LFFFSKLLLVTAISITLVQALRSLPPTTLLTQTYDTSQVIFQMKHQPMGSVLIPGDRAPTKYMDLLFVALMSPMKIAGAVFLMQAKIFSTVAQIPKGQPYGMTNAYSSIEMRVSLAD
jgi:hypothetical protein